MVKEKMNDNEKKCQWKWARIGKQKKARQYFVEWLEVLLPLATTGDVSVLLLRAWLFYLNSLFREKKEQGYMIKSVLTLLVQPKADV